MNKVAFIFPGQGSQYTGMGQDLYNEDEHFKAVIESASHVSGYNLEKIIYSDDDRLNETRYTQIAMLAVEAAILDKLSRDGIRCDIAAGLSLGEYGALLASESISKEDAFFLVTRRGALMQDAYPTGGAMCAVLGMEADKISEVIGGVEGLVSIANYNCPGQIVITGEHNAVEDAIIALKENGARKCIPLKVSGPFHSKLLESASQELMEELNKVKFSDPKIPYISNVGAQYVTKAEDIPGLLKMQICSSVMWQQSVEKMIHDGVDTFVEIGPKKSLCGFLRKIDRSVVAYNIEDAASYAKTYEALKNS